MSEMMRMPDANPKYKRWEVSKADRDSFNDLVNECFAAENVAKNADAPWQELAIPDSEEKAARLLVHIENMEHPESAGLDVDMLREGKIRFVEPTERAIGFFDDLKKDKKEKEEETLAAE